jgi:hypothetical protein
MATLSGLDGMAAAERDRAYDRFQIIHPFLEQGVPLTRIA